MTANRVGTSAPTYNTWAAWEAAAPANLVSITDTWEGDQDNEELTVSSGSIIVVAGTVTNDTYKLIMRAGSGNGFADNATPGSTALRYQPTVGAAVKCTTAWVNAIDFGSSSATRCDIIGLQFQTTSSNTTTLFVNTSTQAVKCYQCIFEGAGTYRVLNMYKNSGDNHVLQNCVVIATNAGAQAFRCNGLTVQYCTLYCAATSVDSAIEGQYGTATLTNCLILNFNDWQKGTQNHSGNYCVTDLGSWESSTFTNSTLSATASSEIENDSAVASTCDLRAKSGGNCDAGGTNISGVTLDIYGQTRDGSTPTIGAFELNVGGGGGSIPIFAYHYNHHLH